MAVVNGHTNLAPSLLLLSLQIVESFERPAPVLIFDRRIHETALNLGNRFEKRATVHGEGIRWVQAFARTLQVIEEGSSTQALGDRERQIEVAFLQIAEQTPREP